MRDIFYDQLFDNRLSTSRNKSKINSFSSSFDGAFSKFRGREKERLSVSNKRLLVLFTITLTLVFVLVYRVFLLQVINWQRNLSLSERNKNRNFSVMAERGVIYDSTGKILARNKPSFSIEFDTVFCRRNNSCEQILAKLSEFTLLNIDINKFKDEISKGKETLILKMGLNKAELESIESRIANFEGVFVSYVPVRDYLYDKEFSHVLGYVGFSDKYFNIIEGKLGIEKSYNEYLTGKEGVKTADAGALGGTFNFNISQTPVPGRDVHLFINERLQLKAYELLKNVVEKEKLDGASIVAQDPKTGGVLALVSYPSFSANDMTLGISKDEYSKLANDGRKPFFNRAISGAYPPGSVFKMVTAAAALAEKYVSKYTKIFDKGYISVGGSTFRNWKLDGHGEVDLLRAIQVSNDTYFYSLGGGYGGIKGLGIKKMYEWARKFGYGELLGIDIDGEVRGYMPDGTGRAWYLGDNYITAIGQGDVLATPLQVNGVTVFFANGGRLLKPQVLKNIEGDVSYKPILLSNDLIDRETYELVREGMSMSVSKGGTAYPLFDYEEKMKIKLGGKTGTAEYKDKEGNDKTHAWFTVFGPFDDANIAMTVFLEGGGAGSDDASPIAKELLDLWFSQK